MVTNKFSPNSAPGMGVTQPKCSLWHGSGCPIPGIVLAQQSQPALGMAVDVHVPGITVTNARNAARNAAHGNGDVAVRTYVDAQFLE